MSGSVWIVSYILLWLAVVVLGFSVVALLRQVGVLHLRVAPMGVHFAGEGPQLDTPAPTVDGLDYRASAFTVLAFTSPGCDICRSLKPDLARIGRHYREIELRFIDHGQEPELFGQFQVRSTPYLVTIDGDGIVRSRGVANSIDQAEEMLAEVLAGPPIDLSGGDGTTAPADPTPAHVPDPNPGSAHVPDADPGSDRAPDPGTEVGR